MICYVNPADMCLAWNTGMFKSFMTGRHEIQRHLKRIEEKEKEQHENSKTEQEDSEVSTGRAEQ